MKDNENYFYIRIDQYPYIVRVLIHMTGSMKLQEIVI